MLVSQFERVYWEWLRQDAAYVGEGGGEKDIGKEEGEEGKGDGEGGHDEGGRGFCARRPSK